MSSRKRLLTDTPILNGSDHKAQQDAYLRAVNLLARRDHTVAELKQKLAVRGFPEDSIEEALARLITLGVLDDRRFAAHWTEAALRNGRGYGLRIRQELQRKGIPREIAAETVAAAAAENPEFQVLATIVAKRFAAFDLREASLKEKQRVYGYLQRRGFSLQVINGYFTNQDRGV